MKKFHIWYVGIALAIALCNPAKAIDTPLLESPVWTSTKEVEQYRLPRMYRSTPYDVRKQNLILVHEVASKYGHPEVLQAMLLQESNGGTHPTLIGLPNARPSKRSYGILQVQIATARSIFKQYPEVQETYFPNREIKRISDREIMHLLINNHAANVEIAAVLFELYLRMSNGNVDRTIAAYNVGIGGVKKLRSPSRFKYVVEVKQKMETVVKPFNDTYGLHTTNKNQRSVVFIQ